jgi:hypothetical protein
LIKVLTQAGSTTDQVNRTGVAIGSARAPSIGARAIVAQSVSQVVLRISEPSGQGPAGISPVSHSLTVLSCSRVTSPSWC